MENKNDLNLWKSLMAEISTFTKICAIFLITAVLVIFFNMDLMRLLTPFIQPLLLLFLFLVFVILAIASVIHMIRRFNTNPVDAFIPFYLNVLTASVAIFLFLPIQNLRVDLEFMIKSNRYQESVEWVIQSIQNGEIDLEAGKEKTIELSSQHRGLADGNRIYVTQEKDVISIFFSRGGGMFELYPGYKYRSDNSMPPDDGDIICNRRIRPHWYDCY